MKLISMTDFVLKQKSREYSITAFSEVLKYAKLLKQNLELWMFVPCDDDGNVLEEPNINKFYKGDEYYRKYEIYQQAKERCLFEYFEVQNTKDWIEFYGGIRVYIPSNDLGNMVSVVFRESEPMNKIIEDLVKYNLQLTQTAQKQIGL